jgi:hypothetical protein
MPAESAPSPTVPISRVASVRRPTSKARYVRTNSTGTNASAKSARVANVRGVVSAAACKPAATCKRGTAPYETTWVPPKTACASGEATCITTESAWAASKSAGVSATESATHVAAAATVETTAATGVSTAAAATTVSTAAAMLSERG